MRDLVGEAVDKGDGWHRFFCLAFDKSWLPEESSGRHRHKTQNLCDWQRAWHGCKVEALCSIMCVGRLVASRDTSHGDRVFRTSPGVYAYESSTVHKFES